MVKKIVVPITALSILVLILVWYRVIRLPFFPIHPHQAIPSHTALFYEMGQPEMEKLLAAPSAVAGLFLPQNLTGIFTLMQEVAGQAWSWPKGRTICIATNPSRHLGTDLLLVLPGARSMDLDVLKHRQGWQSRTYQFDNQEVVSLVKKGKTCSFTRFRNLFLFAQHAYVVENAISQLKSPHTSVCTDYALRRLTKEAPGKPGTFSLFVHFENLPAQFAPILNTSRLNQLKKLTRQGRWMRLNLPASGTPSAWTGAFVPPAGFSLLTSSPPLSDDIWQAIPDNLSGFIALRAPLAPTIFPSSRLNATLGTEVVMAIGEPLGNGRFEQFFLIELTNAEAAEEALAHLPGASLAKQYQMFDIYRINSPAHLPVLQNKTTFATSSGSHLLLANNLAAVERWLGKHLAGQTCATNTTFLQLKKQLPGDANLFFNMNSIKGWQVIAPWLNDQVLRSLNRNPLPFDEMLAGLTWKNGIGQLRFVTASSQHIPAADRPANILWSAPLSAAVARCPAVFTNPETGQKEILAIDENNNLYLISSTGQTLWKRPMPGPILSDPVQIDLNKTRERQFVLNTPTAIYVIDHNGEDTDGFPLQLEVPATNAVSVVDFFQSNDYSFFIACENGNVYGFDEKGSPIEGWRPNEGVGEARHPLLHFQANGKDFLTLLTSDGTLKVFKKNGTYRFPPVHFNSDNLSPPGYQIQKKASRIVTADPNGKVYVTNLAGKHFGLRLKTGNNSDIKFLFSDVTADNRKDYLALSGKEITINYYDKNKFVRGRPFSYPWPQDTIFEVTWHHRHKAFIGSVNARKNLLLLMDGNGKIPARFPLAGSTPFIISDLSGNGKPVVVCGNEANVTAYLLE